MSSRFRVKDRTRHQSRDMIQMMAKHGDNPFARMGRRFETDADVKRLFAFHGYDYADVVQRCRKMDEAVPLLENILESTWEVVGDAPGTVSVVREEMGETIASLEEPGVLATPTYEQHFENAVDRFCDYLEFPRPLGSFQSWLSSGIASIEEYIEHRASLHNSRHPSDQLVDSREHKVPFHKKIDECIPKMSGGKKLDKGRQNWAHFKRLRRARNDLAIHTKKRALAISYKDLRELLNLFRSGMAGLLVDLHLLFGEPIPSIIVKYAYLGDIELIKEEGP